VKSNSKTMNTRLTKKVMALIASLLIISTAAFSQLDAINGDFFKGGVNDGVKLLTSYITPWANAFGAGFNGGWYNTAKPHKFGGFDITITGNVGFVPASAQNVDLKTLGFQTLKLGNPSGSGLSPTIAGPSDPGPQLYAMDPTGTVELARFNAPEGVNLKFMPVPMVQAGIGLPFGTEVKVRYFPSINVNDYKIGLWGLGLEHSIMQYIPGNDLLPFDVSLFGGFSKLSGGIPISVQPTASGAIINYSPAYNVLTSFADQSISTTIKAWNVGVIASVKVAVLTFYGGLGYSKTSTNLAFTGMYPLPRANPAVSLTQPVYEDAGVVKNITPIAIENFSGLRANIGMRLKLAVLTIHGDYTRSQYNVFSGGIGVSFR
jgi:hypothetical protein